MDEARKTNAIRGPEFSAKYLGGKVIDIGAGSDLVCGWAERFDIEDGDANVITHYRQVGTYDVVHSSHCLEHMHNPASALLEWWSLLKPGGYLIVVVPEEDLYEQGIWPSIFNTDHKSSFRLDKPSSWSPASFDIRELMSKLPNCQLLTAETHDIGYDYSLQKKYGEKNRPVRGTWRLAVFCKKIPFGRSLLKVVQRVLFKCGAAIDQTLGEALAQLQVVARKEA
jgi:SAM-dependent methyltransferase